MIGIAASWLALLVNVLRARPGCAGDFSLTPTRSWWSATDHQLESPSRCWAVDAGVDKRSRRANFWPDDTMCRRRGMIGACYVVGSFDRLALLPGRTRSNGVSVGGVHLSATVSWRCSSSSSYVGSINAARVVVAMVGWLLPWPKQEQGLVTYRGERLYNSALTRSGLEAWSTQVSADLGRRRSRQEPLAASIRSRSVSTGAALATLEFSSKWGGARRGFRRIKAAISWLRSCEVADCT